MSDDVDFMILTRSLDRDLGRRAAVMRSLKRCLLLIVPVAVLAVLAALLVLTNTAVVVITLAVVAMVIFELCRRGLGAERPGERPGGRLG
jgi:Flp pilus assembly protein TadB